LSEASSDRLSDLFPFPPKFEMTFFSFESFCSKARSFAANLVATTSHPLTNPFFGLVVLVAVGGADAVAASRAVVVEDGEDGGFVDRSERG
jgi:hypothetical protein